MILPQESADVSNTLSKRNVGLLYGLFTFGVAIPLFGNSGSFPFCVFIRMCLAIWQVRRTNSPAAGQQALFLSSCGLSTLLSNRQRSRSRATFAARRVQQKIHYCRPACVALTRQVAECAVPR